MSGRGLHTWGAVVELKEPMPDGARRARVIIRAAGASRARELLGLSGICAHGVVDVELRSYWGRTSASVAAQTEGGEGVWYGRATAGRQKLDLARAWPK